MANEFIFSATEQELVSTATDFLYRVILQNWPNPTAWPDGVQGTECRLVKMWDELTRGYKESPEEILKVRFKNEEKYDELVLLKDIDFYSVCEHHALPFSGVAHVGYIVKDQVVGLSKLARLVDCFSRRLQIQERMTKQIADALMENLNPLGVGVVVEAQHLCMVARGVGKQRSKMTTSCMLGVLREKPEARAEFLRLIV